MASCHPLSTRLSVPPSQTAYHFSARDQATQDGDPFAHPGAEDLPQLCSGGWTPGSQGWKEKETDSRANRRETELGTLRQLRGGWTGRQIGAGVFGAWQMQGLIAGASLGADPGTSSGDAGGNDGAGLGHSLPVLPRSPQPELPELQAGYPGRLWASLSLPGHLGGVGPANGTRPVGLGEQPHIRLHSCLSSTPAGSAFLGPHP